MRRKLICLALAFSMLISVVSAMPASVSAADSPMPYTLGEETAAVPAGSGTEDDPYRIYTSMQLDAFAEILPSNPQASAVLKADIKYNTGYKFSVDIDTALIRVTDGNKVGYLGSSILGFFGGNTQFDSAASELGVWYTESGGIYTASQEPVFALEEYTPMASSNIPYVGKFDGAGFSVSGIYCIADSSDVGLFAKLGSGADICNLTVADSLFMTSNSSAGAIAGFMYAETAETVSISNCSNKGTAVVAKRNAAGILGMQDAAANMHSYPIVKNCKNSGDIISADYAGGIIGGSTRGSVVSSEYGMTSNSGTVYAAGKYAAGITPNLVNGNQTTNCFNSGSIYAKEYAAGIAAQTNRAITRCINTGSINAENYAAGIVCRYNENYDLQFCGNLGVVTAKTYAAGITVGLRSNQKAPKISECYNAGEIIADIRAAGIACVSGYQEWIVAGEDGDTLKSVGTTIKNCVSTDTVKALIIESHPICAYYEKGAAAAEDCSVVSERYIACGAYAYEHDTVFRQNMSEDSYPTPSGKAEYVLYKRLSSDGSTYYSNSESDKIHSVHINENADCYCDICSYVYQDYHVNSYFDCYCDICGEGIIDGHSYTSGGLCRACGGFEDGITALYASRLIISDTVRVVLYMKLAPAVASNKNAKAKIKLGTTALDEVYVTEAEQKDGYHIFYIDVEAKKLNDKITIQITGITSGNGKIHEYSVKEYLDGLDAADKTLEQVTEALRLWAGAAQLADGYNKDNIISDGFEMPEITLPENVSTEKEGSISGMTHHSTSISVSEKLSLRLLFSGIEGVTFMLDGKRLTPKEATLGRYSIEISGISPDELDKEFTVIAVKDGEVYKTTHSIKAEICKRIKGGNNQEKHLNLYRAILNYADSLKNVGGVIIYNMNGGELETEIKDFGSGEAVKLPTEGMSYKINGIEQKFIGWFSDPELKVPTFEVPADVVGEYNVYAKWEIDFLKIDYSQDEIISSGSSDSVTLDNITYNTPASSGASFVAEQGALIWKAAAQGSFINAISAIGNVRENLPRDGYASFVVKLSDISMQASFGIGEGENYFEFFKTTEAGKVYISETELLPDESGAYSVVIVLDYKNSTITAYGSDEKPIASVRAELKYNNQINILLEMYSEKIGENVFSAYSNSKGSLKIDSIEAIRGHIFRLHDINYNLGGGEFKEDAVYPEEYSSTGEPTKLPSKELMQRDMYFFSGWYADSNFEIPIDEISIYELGIVDVYAKWAMVIHEIDYDDIDATDPNIFEVKGGKSANHLSYNVYGGIGTYKVLADESGEKYLLAATELSGSQITGSSPNKYADITSNDRSVSFIITIGACGSDFERRNERDENGNIIEFTDIIDEGNFTDTYLRLRANINGKNQDLLYVFKIDKRGEVTMGNKKVAQLNLDGTEPLTLRIVADFKNGRLIMYDENGALAETADFSLYSGASTYEEMLRLLTTETYCMRLNTDNAALKLYGIKIVESNIFAE